MSDPGAGQGHDPPLARRTSPSTARRRLGEQLRSIRERADLTLSEAAASIERSAPTLSRLENGKVLPRLVDVKALLDRYAEVVPGSVPVEVRSRIIELTHSSRDEEWFTSFRDVLSSDKTRDDLARFVAYENDAEEIRAFEPELVPGLLQTPAYAADVINHFFADQSSARRGRLADFRIARQEAIQLRAEALRLRVVIGELVVRHSLSAPAVMREQLARLLASARGEAVGVELRVLPMARSVAAAIGGPFVVMSLPEGEPDVVYIETREGALYRHDDVARRRYSRHFQEVLDAALGFDESARLISDALTALD